jgi:phage-related holin
MSYFAKSNIQNSVFPSFAMLFPKKPQGREELELIKETVNKLKGAENAGKAVAFFANNQEQLPKIEAIPTNSNARLYLTRIKRPKHGTRFVSLMTIDPILLGVRTTGSLGNGSDIKQAYVILKRSVIIPLREMVTEIVDQLVKIAGIKTNVTIINYQIINETISAVEDEGNATMEALNAMSPLVATKVLEMIDH